MTRGTPPVILRFIRRIQKGTTPCRAMKTCTPGVQGYKIRKNSFTFIELLLSLAILGILFIPMMQLFSQSLYSSTASRKIITATNLAKWQMEKLKNLKLSKKEIKEKGNMIFPAEGEPSFEINDIKWRIERQVVEKTDPLEVRIAVYSQGSPAEPIITLVTLFEDKTWVEYKPLK